MNNGEYNNNFEEKEEIIFDFQPPINAKEESKSFSRIGLGLALLSAVVWLSSLIVVIIVGLINEEFVNSILFANLLSPLCIYGFGLPILMTVIGKMPVSPPEKKNMKLSSWLVFLIVGLGMMYIGAFIGNAVMDSLSAIFGYNYENGLEGLIDPGSLWITAIFMVVVAPIGEEFIFRKLLIDRMAKYGSVVAISVSALAFALMHGTFYQFFYAFALGLVLGYVYFNTGKLYLTIGLHATLNFVGSILSSLLQNGLLSMTEDLEKVGDGDATGVILNHWPALVAMVIFEILIYGSMICAVVIPLIQRKRIIIKRGEVHIPRGQGLSVVIMNAGMLLMLAVYAVTFIINLLPVA